MNMNNDECEVKLELETIKYAIDAIFKRVKCKGYYNEQWWLDFEDYLNKKSNVDFNKGDLE